jgi:hypothetical protein
MTTLTYQNQDLDNINPLQTDQSKKFSLPKDPKIRILIILGIIVVLLLIASIFTSSSKKTVRPPARIIPTITPNITPLPTEITDISSLPLEIKKNLEDVDIKINTSIEFNPPQIDTEIGL